MATRSAYRTLSAIFSTFQANLEELDRLLGLKWASSDGEQAMVDRTSHQIALLRNRQIELLASTENDIAGLLEEAEAEKPFLSAWERANLREMGYIYSYYSGMATDAEIIRHVESLEEIAKNAESLWERAHDIYEHEGGRAAFAAQLPVLENLFDLKRQIAGFVAAEQGCTIAEAVIGEWNHYVHMSDIEAVFADVRRHLPAIVSEIRKTLAGKPSLIAPGKIPAARQMEFFQELKDIVLAEAGWTAEDMRYHGVHVQLMAHANGFSAGSRKEVRVGIEVDEENFIAGLKNLMHELGHTIAVLHPNKMPEDIRDQPVAAVRSKNVHETIAIFFEKITQSKKFYELLLPLMEKHFGVLGPAWEASNMQKLATRPDVNNTGWYESELYLAPNMAFRVLAEKRIFDGEMAVSELPAFWAETMTAYTGITHRPEDYYVQESHWLDVYAGYFWAYQKGEISAIQARARLLRNNPELMRAQTIGEYLRIHTNFAEAELYGRGSFLTPPEHLQKAAGRRGSLQDYYIHLSSLATGELNLTHGEFNPAAGFERTDDQPLTPVRVRLNLPLHGDRHHVG